MGTCRRVYNEEVRRHIVSEIEDGSLSIADAAREYGIAKSLVGLWLKEYGKFRPERNIVEVVMKSEKEKISELEKALAEAHLKMRVYDEIIKLAGKKYKVDLKKTFGTAQPETLERKELKSKLPVKS